MNLKGFKKVQDDNDKAVLKNDKGHSITIAKSALTQKHLEDLNSLPLHAASGTDTGTTDNDDIWTKFSKQMVPSMWAPPDRTPASEEDEDSDNAPQATPQPTPSSAPTPVPPPQPSPTSTAQPRASNDTGGGQLLSALRQQSERKWIPPEAATITDDLPDDAAATDGSQPQNPNRVTTVEASVDPQEQQPAADQTSEVQPPSSQDAKLLKTAYENEKLQEHSNFRGDLQSGQITPETYHDLMTKGGNKDVLGRIGTIFGLMVSGIGSGLSHQPNMAMQMMDKEIQNNLDAQQKTMANQQNLLALNYQHQVQEAQVRGMDLDQSLKTAGLSYLPAAYGQSHAIKDAHLQKMVDSLPESPDKQRFQQALNIVYQDSAQRTINATKDAADQLVSDPEMAFAQRHEAMMKAAALTGNPGLMAQAQSLEQHHFTGYQQPANRPIAPEDRDALKKLNNLEQTYNDAGNYIQNNWLGPMPFSGNKKTGQALQSKIQFELSGLSGLNRYTKQIADLHKARVPDLIGTHLTSQDMATVDQLKREVHQARASIYASYGIGQGTQPKMSNADRSAATQWLKQNPNHPNADKIKRILGQ